MKFIWIIFIIVFFSSGILMAKNEAQIFGYVEKVTLLDKKLTLSAKLDTGAKTASLNAKDITKFEINGVPYVRFTVPTKDKNYLFECPYVGRVKIKVRTSETNPSFLASTPIKRPVVMLSLQLGDKIRTLRVNLTSRKHFLYPLLLGRDAIIAFNGAVNPALTFILKSKSHNEHEK